MDATRTYLLLGISVVGGAALGSLAGFVVMAGFGMKAGALGGAFVGVASSAVVLPALERKNLEYAVPISYVPAALVAVSTAAIEPVLLVPATGLALTLGLLGAYLWCPNAPTRYPRGHCRSCGYDLAGLSGRVCPECGADCPSAFPRYERERLVVVWLTIVAFVMLALIVKLLL